jgi:hypothetical protein
MTSSLRELARERLEYFRGLGVLKRAPTLEWVWQLAALQSLIEGKLLEPGIDTLEQLTAKERIWKELSPAWPPDHVGTVIAAIVSSHRLAIMKHDDDWLTRLHAAWEACPEDLHYLLQLRVQGEIGLGLAPGGPRPAGWSDEEMSELEDGGFLTADAVDRAWRALAENDLEAARRALLEYEHTLAALPEKWEAAPSEGLLQILAHPDSLFQVERRALAALLDRARP